MPKLDGTNTVVFHWLPTILTLDRFLLTWHVDIFEIGCIGIKHGALHYAKTFSCEVGGHKIRVTRAGLKWWWWNEWIWRKVAENCDSRDSTGWLGLHACFTTPPPCSHKLSMRKTLAAVMMMMTMMRMMLLMVTLHSVLHPERMLQAADWVVGSGKVRHLQVVELHPSVHHSTTLCITPPTTLHPLQLR